MYEIGICCVLYTGNIIINISPQDFRYFVRILDVLNLYLMRIPTGDKIINISPQDFFYIQGHLDVLDLNVIRIIRNKYNN